jgi:multiple sugar transport system ATP-binding protein
VAGFIGMPQMNFFDDAKLIKQNGKYAVVLGGMTVELSADKQLKLAANKVEPQDIVLGVRPEHITLEKGLLGVVDVSELMGSSVHLHVDSLGRDVVVVVSTMNMTGAEVEALTSGAAIQYNFPGHCCHVFNKETGINLEA